MDSESGDYKDMNKPVWNGAKLKEADLQQAGEVKQNVKGLKYWSKMLTRESVVVFAYFLGGPLRSMRYMASHHMRPLIDRHNLSSRRQVECYTTSRH